MKKVNNLCASSYHDFFLAICSALRIGSPSISSEMFNSFLLKQKYCIITTLLLFWCPYMVTNVSVQCNGEFLSDSKILCDSMDRVEFFVPTTNFPTQTFCWKV